MVVNYTGVVYSVISGLTVWTFGSFALTCTVLMTVLVLFAILIRVPVPFALALNIPLSIVFAAYGFMSPLVAGLLSVAFLSLSIASFVAGVGVKN